MNVFFISSWYPNKVTPVNGDFVQRHAKAISRLHKVKVLHVQYDKSLVNRLSVEVNHINPNLTEHIYYFNLKGRFRKVLKPLLYFKYYIKGYNKLYDDGLKPDIVHSNVIFPSGLIALLLNYWKKVRYIVSEHFSIYLPQTKHAVPKWRRLIERSIVKKALAICPVTNNLATSLKSHGYSGVYKVVPNVVDVDLFKLSHKEKSSIISFLHVSSLQNKSKNIAGLLKTVYKLSEIRQDFILNIVGGDELDEHRRLAQDLNILDKIVFFHGEQPHQDIPKYLCENDVFVMFSNYESLPCVLVESLSCGVPVIATDVGGIKEHINDSNGILVNPGDENGLLKALLHMLDNSSQFNPDTIRQYAVANFSELAIAEEFTKVYKISSSNA